MKTKKTAGNAIHSSIEPWITVKDGAAAVSFYKTAFGATETYRMEDPGGGLVVKFSVDGAGFWISGESDDDNTADKTPSAAGCIRMILTVTDPIARFAQALKAGATEVFPVGEGHGWLLGRLVDPFGNHWEIGRPLDQ